MICAFLLIINCFYQLNIFGSSLFPVGCPLQTDLIERLLLPLRLFLAIEQKINHKDIKAQRCILN